MLCCCQYFRLRTNRLNTLDRFGNVKRNILEL